MRLVHVVRGAVMALAMAALVASCSDRSSGGGNAAITSDASAVVPTV
jgi:hypothetical protein